ncbi:putative phosphatase IMPL1, chloroplastic isoform X1 [Sesbania bispinosa]|nr:putative phosphatase IMPL1, chloroplastic isoform X1 [Sesbania bispinosa]
MNTRENHSPLLGVEKACVVTPLNSPSEDRWFTTSNVFLQLVDRSFSVRRMNSGSRSGSMVEFDALQAIAMVDYGKALQRCFMVSSSGSNLKP